MTDYVLDFVGPGASLALAAADRAETAADAAELASATALAATRYFTSVALGEAGSTTGQLFSTDDGAGNLIFYERTGGGSVEVARAVTPVTLAGYASLAGVQTISGKTFSGNIDFFTSNSRIGITSEAAPISAHRALLHIENHDAVSCGLLTSSYWTGSTAAPYANNDCSLWETYNNVVSNSANRSWSGSFPNAYNNIPVGVTDSGTRVGVIGWAVTVDIVGYEHAGTLATQVGVQGTAGFQGTGTPATAIITNATGVQGQVYADSAGATIVNARAGEFISDGSVGEITNNTAVYAFAANGNSNNYSFYGGAGKLYNLGQGLFSNTFTEMPSYLCARNPGPVFEFGFPDPGYGSSFGASFSSGRPYFAFCAEADPSGNTFRTRGRLGTVITNDLAGALIFSRLTNATASGQTLTECMRIDANGHLVLVETPYLPTKTPASAAAAGTAGEVAWDVSYIYICTATNTWKRVAIATW